MSEQKNKIEDIESSEPFPLDADQSEPEKQEPKIEKTKSVELTDYELSRIIDFMMMAPKDFRDNNEDFKAILEKLESKVDYDSLK